MLSKSKDSISTIIILDLIESGLIDKTKYDNSYWLSELNENSLMNENWLIAYEMSIKKWIGSDFSYLNDVPYFKLLCNKKVEFYNPSLQIEPIDISSIGGDDKKDSKEPDTTYDKSSNTLKDKTTLENDMPKTITIEDIFDIDVGIY